MTNEEAKHALLNRTPVKYNDTVYLRILELVYWIDESDGFHISATLLDKNRHSSIRPEIKDVISIHD